MLVLLGLGLGGTLSLTRVCRRISGTSLWISGSGGVDGEQHGVFHKAKTPINHRICLSILTATQTLPPKLRCIDAIHTTNCSALVLFKPVESHALNQACQSWKFLRFNYMGKYVLRRHLRPWPAFLRPRGR